MKDDSDNLRKSKKEKMMNYFNLIAGKTDTAQIAKNESDTPKSVVNKNIEN